MQEEQLVREIQKGLLQWYAFRRGSRILYIGEKGDALAEMLEDRSLKVVYASCEQTCDEKWQQEYMEGFHYLVAIKTLESQLHPEVVLRTWKNLLKADGTLLLGMNNRLGIRYFCGDRDPYTGRNFDGVEGYRRAYARDTDIFRGRCYDQSELKGMLKNSGWSEPHFFSVLPDLVNPSLLYAEEYLPNEDLSNRLFPTYHTPDTVFLEEENLYETLAENGMFHKMANAWLIECTLCGEFSDVIHVTSSMGRDKEDAFLTILHNSGMVEKRAVYPEGQERLAELKEHEQDLQKHGIPVVESRVEGNSCVMPYIEGETGQIYLKRLLKTDKNMFLKKMDQFRDLILQSSDMVRPDNGDGQGAVLRKGYLDMVPLNSFHQQDTFVFYDQEFCADNYPANAIIARMVMTFYSGNAELQKILPMDRLFERYGLLQKLDQWKNMEWEFLSKLRNEKELWKYHERHRRNAEIVNSNRQRLNFSEETYQRLFVDIFRNADTRKLILFGSGIFAKRFLALYSGDYPAYAVIDNNEEKWGQELCGICIQSPELLTKLQSGEYKVLICIKNYVSVMKQLDAMGVTEYSIFDSLKDYPRKKKPVVQALAKETVPKKYHVGYIAGVFDLFHIGHLNMFRRAKEQCDYLIVGVVTDEGVRRFKGKETFISFEERIEIVRSCRYVDEAVEIPLEYGDTIDAYRMHHFDCQFSGSDYVNDSAWLAKKEFLEKHGAELVFFPYTESTSSTRIKSLIEKKLL